MIRWISKFCFLNFWHNMPLPWQHTFRHCQKYFLHIYTLRQHYVPNFIWNAFLPTIFGIICRYHGNTLSSTVEKCVLHNYTYGQHVCQISFEFLLKCCFSRFRNDMLHGNARSATVQKCVMHIYNFKANMCANFNWKMLFPHEFLA